MTGTTSEFGSEFDSLRISCRSGSRRRCWPTPGCSSRSAASGGWSPFCSSSVRRCVWPATTSRPTAGERRHFVGLSSPVAAGSMAAVAFAFPAKPAAGSTLTALLLLLLVATLALLMVSRFRYRSFKDLGLRDRRSYIYVLPLAVMMVGILIWPRWVMLAIAATYLLSAPVVSDRFAFSGPSPDKDVSE